MKKRNRKCFGSAVCLHAAFVCWTAAVRLVDVQAIGPYGSVVGFAYLNGFLHRLTGVHMSLYRLTDWLSLIPIGFAVGFALLGLYQWIRRKDIRKVDRSLLVLGGFYLAVLAAYVFFEIIPVNHRPVLLDGYLEASYPSSTTMLVLCIMPTAALQLRTRIRRRVFRNCVCRGIYGFTGLMVLLRFLSGVHWFTDIAGGILLSAGLVLLYISFVSYTGAAYFSAFLSMLTKKTSTPFP